jgi:hypothetical protein
MGQQHYRFAFGGLKQFAFERTAQLQEALWSEPAEFLAWLWTQCADGPDQPAPGLSARTLMVGDRPAALITLPEPAEPPNAYFVLIVFGASPPDFFSLEKASLDFGGTGTVLGYWLPDRRENLGSGSAPLADDFLESVLSKIGPRS